MCLCHKSLSVIEHKSFINRIKSVYSSFVRFVGTQINSALGDEFNQSEVDRVLKSAFNNKTEAYISTRLQKLELSIANGTVKQTLRGTPLRNLQEGLTGSAKKRFLKEVATRATSINETMKEHIRVVAKDILEKDGTLLDFQEALKVRLKEELSQRKADVIARTEYRSAYTSGQNEAVNKLDKKGYEITRIWRTSGTNVRDSHQIDGEERAVGELFSNGLEYPMDPNASIEDIINCNCSLEIVVKEKE